jgi:hypothetical protein
MDEEGMVNEGQRELVDEEGGINRVREGVVDGG